MDLEMANAKYDLEVVANGCYATGARLKAKDIDELLELIDEFIAAHED